MNQLLLKQYLLGGLEDPELSEVEQAIAADDSWYQQASSVEDELIEDYLSDLLSPQEKENFQQYFLVTSARREKLAVLAALQAKANAVKASTLSAEPPQNTAEPKAENWLQKLLAVNFLRPVYAVPALLLVVGISGAIWYFQQPKKSLDTGAQIASASAQATAAPIKITGDKRRLAKLSPGVVRSMDAPGKTTEVELNAEIAQLDLQLPLQLRQSQTPIFRVVVLLAVRDEIFKQENVTVNSAAGNHWLQVSVPAEKLLPGLYSVRVEKKNDEGRWALADNYEFQVRRT